MSHQIKKNNFGPNPSSIIEIIILEALKYTYDKDLFILADSGYGDPDRIIILATEKKF